MVFVQTFTYAMFCLLRKLGMTALHENSFHWLCPIRFQFNAEYKKEDKCPKYWTKNINVSHSDLFIYISGQESQNMDTDRYSGIWAIRILIFGMFWAFGAAAKNLFDLP